MNSWSQILKTSPPPRTEEGVNYEVFVRFVCRYHFDFAEDEFLLLSRINCEDITLQPATNKLIVFPLSRVGVEEVLSILVEDPGRICKETR